MRNRMEAVVIAFTSRRHAWDFKEADLPGYDGLLNMRLWSRRKLWHSSLNGWWFMDHDHQLQMGVLHCYSILLTFLKLDYEPTSLHKNYISIKFIFLLIKFRPNYIFIHIVLPSPYLNSDRDHVSPPIRTSLYLCWFSFPLAFSEHYNISHYFLHHQHHVTKLINYF